MPDLFSDLKARAIGAFHDAEVRAPNATRHADDGPWRFVAQNHDANRQLWDQEDLARRGDVPDAEIVGNKRAIDRLNQARNDAIERLDEALLDRLAAIAPMHDAWHNSETAGSMIDRLSILSLKIFHMNAEAARTDATAEHVARCREKLERLTLQREDLARCLDTLLARASEGRAFWRVYRQFKMYNDPALNPYLRGRR
ncbi:MAG TPA: DUF4254 domain-containing protein [Casimicrobiaceae bacterium]|jgi:hypothetical protein|nr:DUF4254 domain-containing protein [Casimicrobiaceae bacterium]